MMQKKLNQILTSLSGQFKTKTKMISKREPKHMGEVMSDIAERYNKLTKTKMSKEENTFRLKGTEVEPSTISFNISDTTEIIKLCENGDIFIKGKLIENDKEVVDAMREFLIDSGHLNQNKDER